VIRVGIVGCNYGRLVQLPAFRRAPGCCVIGLAGSQLARTEELARASDIRLAFGDWRELVDHPDVDAVTIGTPPELQPAIAIRALETGKAVFAEKPLAADLEGGKAMMKAALVSGKANMIDFSFCAIPAWMKAKQLLDEGAVGPLRHVAVNWQVENYATRMRIRNWKSSEERGGGPLGNFVSHSFHYLEWMCGPIVRLSAHLSGLPDEPDFKTNATITVSLHSGASGSIAMSCASYLGSGHRVEFYGEDGTLSLINSTQDHMRGFELRVARRPAGFSLIEADDPLDRGVPEDGRIAPVGRLAIRFLEAIENGHAAAPGFVDGLRVQALLEAARFSNRNGNWVDVGSEIMGASA
jgi:predicted dehydrogenase